MSFPKFEIGQVVKIVDFGNGGRSAQFYKLYGCMGRIVDVPPSSQDERQWSCNVELHTITPECLGKVGGRYNINTSGLELVETPSQQTHDDFEDEIFTKLEEPPASPADFFSMFEHMTKAEIIRFVRAYDKYVDSIKSMSTEERTELGEPDGTTADEVHAFPINMQNFHELMYTVPDGEPESNDI